jgi:hypothetical protein
MGKVNIAPFVERVGAGVDRAAFASILRWPAAVHI